MDEEEIDLSEAYDKIVERDELGRFKGKEPAEEASVELPEETPEVEETPSEEIPDQGEVKEPEPAVQPLSAPERWSAEWKAKFAALPREAQEVLISREGEYDKGYTQKAQEAAEYKRKYEPIEQVLEPRRQQFAMQGMTLEQGMTQLFALSDMAAKTPLEFARMFISNHRIDPATLFQQANNDPLNPILNKVTSLEQQLKQQQEQQQASETDRIIQSFASTPGHEHFNDVRAHMGALLNAGVAKDMEDAYQQACRASPVVSERLQQEGAAKAEADRKSAEAKRAADASAAASKARKAAGATLSSNAVGKPDSPSLSLDEILSRKYDELKNIKD